ncbi:hypothetical protein GPALN_010678 [Globodera pallida]|nr:hypothetical protein GPALN_010678 [Globodera pallida]
MRIFRSLFVIVSVNISGYFVMDFYISAITQKIELPMSLWKWNQIVTIVLNISAASNAPILYLSSSEYRKAFRKELVYKLCEIILIEAERMMDNKSNVQASEQQPPALYTFVKQYFVEIIGKKTPVPTSKEKLLHCTLFSFGWELHFRVRFTYKEFLDYFFAKITIGHFILVKEELCKEKSIEKDLKRYFNENLVNFGKAINIDFSPHNELQQICREIVMKIEQMLRNGDDWNYAYLNNSKMMEWNLLEYDLRKMGNDQKWEEIEQLRGEWKKAYDEWVFNKEKVKKPIFEEIMKNLIKILRGFIMPQIVREIVEEIEQMLQHGNWNYEYLNYLKDAEWNFLENDLRKSGHDQKWDEIEQLRGKKTYNEEVYNKFAEERPCWTLVVFASLYTFVAELNGSANKLLALYSLFEMVHQSGHFLFVYTVFSGHYLVAFPIAVRILSPSFFAFGCTTLLLFFTSIDRLLYVLFPLRTAQNDNAIICCVVLPISGLFGAFYVSPSISNSNQFNMRIFRSLFLIVSVNISGYFVMDLFVSTISLNMELPMAFWIWNQIVTIVLNVSAASNAPILYSTSLEYRKAFRKELEPFIKIFNRNSVQPH